jgi:hypothetical protein
MVLDSGTHAAGLKKASAKIDKRSEMLIALFNRLVALEQAVTTHRSIINGMSETMAAQKELFHSLSHIGEKAADEIPQTEEASAEPVTSTEEVTEEIPTTEQANASDQSADSAESPKETIEKKTNPDSASAKKRRAKRQARKASKKRNR